MRPLYIEFAAFGPYKEKTAIDFTKLNESGIFLITGQTGGGKTTILDAMCIALYGMSTGGKRNFLSMRTTGIEESMPTYVKFDFALGSEQYRFQRECRMKQNRNTKGWSDVQEHSCYKTTNGQPELLVSGADRNVTAKANELLCLTCEQFSQVIVLPQGEFLRFLHSNSKDKGAMLETLFGAGLWRRVTENLSLRLKKLNESTSSLFASRTSLLSKENLTGTDELKARIEAVKLEEKRLESETKQVSEQLDKVSEAYGSAVKYVALKSAMATGAEKLAKSTEEFELAKVQMVSAEKGRLESEKLKSEADELLKRNAGLKEIRNQLLGIEEQLETAKKYFNSAQVQKTALEKISENISALEKRLKKGEDFQKEAEKSSELLLDTMDRLKKLKETLDRFDELDKLRKAENKALEDKNAAERKLSEAKVNGAALTEKLENERKKIEQNEAYHLSLTLDEGKPCPVCGSLNHPNPAGADTERLSNAEMKQLELSEKLARENLVRMESEAEAADGIYQLANKEFITKQLEYKGISKMFREPYEIEYKKALEDEEKYKKLAKQLQPAGEKIKILRSEREQLIAEMNKIKTEIASFSDTGKSIRDQAEKTLESLEFKDVKVIAEEINKTGKAANNIALKVAKLTEEYQKAISRRAAAEASLEEARAALEKAQRDMEEFQSEWDDKAVPDVEALQLQRKALSEKSSEMSQKLGRADSELKSLDRLKTDVEKIDLELKESEEAYKTTKYLSSSLSTGNEKKTPIMQYVLSIMLDEILASANVFFEKVSRGRYALRRYEGDKKGKGYGGLEIELLDGSNTTVRPVNTLSGGEGFLASLSLALGLSEVVQNNSGAITIESLFIDEGFGSLDAETLETAMKALSVVMNGGRTVGIISHVGEIKQYIKTRIEVTHDKAGAAHANVRSED